MSNDYNDENYYWEAECDAHHSEHDIDDYFRENVCPYCEKISMGDDGKYRVILPEDVIKDLSIYLEMKNQ